MVKLLSPVREVKVTLTEVEVSAVTETPITGCTTIGSVLPPLSLPQPAAMTREITVATAARCRVIRMRVVLSM
jgi:hypothetical protein